MLFGGGEQSLPTRLHCQRLLTYAEWEFGVYTVCLFGYIFLCVCVCELWVRHRQRDKLTNMNPKYSSSERDGLLNIWRRQSLQSCGRVDERLRSLTSCASCWDIGSHQNPVRNRRGQFILAQILQNLSVFPSHTGAKEEEKKKVCGVTLLLCFCAYIVWSFWEKTA